MEVVPRWVHSLPLVHAAYIIEASTEATTCDLCESTSAICTHAHACTHAHTCTHAHMHTCTHAHIRMHSCTHPPIHQSTHPPMHIPTHAHKYKLTHPHQHETRHNNCQATAQTDGETVCPGAASYHTIPTQPAFRPRTTHFVSRAARSVSNRKNAASAYSCCSTSWESGRLPSRRNDSAWRNSHQSRSKK